MSVSLDLGLGCSSGFAAIAQWVLPGAIIDEIFTTGQYFPRAIALELVDTRASSKFLTNGSGALVSVGNNALPISSAGMLVEPAGTNNVLQSQGFSTWTSNDTLTLNALAAPDGVVNAAQVISSVSNEFHSLQANNSAVLSGRTDTFSFYVKLIGPAVYFPVVANFSGGPTIVFNLAAGTATLSNGATAGGVIALANGWYRVWGACPSTFTGTTNFFVGMNDISGAWESFAGDGVSGMYYAYPQHEFGVSLPSSFVSTTTVAATRAADSITIQRIGIGRVVFTFDDNSQQTVSGINTAVQYTIPTNLNRPLIKRMTGYAS